MERNTKSYFNEYEIPATDFYVHKKAFEGLEEMSTCNASITFVRYVATLYVITGMLYLVERVIYTYYCYFKLLYINCHILSDNSVFYCLIFTKLSSNTLKYLI